MPDWCNNILRVTGPSEAVERFVGAADGDNEKWKQDEETDHTALCFHKLYPVPDEILQAGYAKAGYAWCIVHWGVKWSIPGGCVESDRGDGWAFYQFSSAWSPPKNWVQHVSELFPECFFTLGFDEPAEGVAGTVVYWKGRAFSSLERACESADEEDPIEEEVA